MKIVYQATDGELFDTEAECLSYEEDSAKNYFFQELRAPQGEKLLVVLENGNSKIFNSTYGIWEFILPTLKKYTEDNLNSECSTLLGLVKYCFNGEEDGNWFGTMFEIFAKKGHNFINYWTF